MVSLDSAHEECRNAGLSRKKGIEGRERTALTASGFSVTASPVPNPKLSECSSPAHSKSQRCTGSGQPPRGRRLGHGTQR